MISLDRLAFVDVETTGLSCATDRITEIGVVVADGQRAREWTTLLNPGTRISEHSRLFNGISGDEVKEAPRFRDVATDLHARLSGRVFIAHNARFDFGFLKTEFQRVGLHFEPPVVCSVMLSRRLFPDFSHHDLDSLISRYSFQAGTRHRALPDAQVLWQFWRMLLTQQSVSRIRQVIEALLAGPVLPAHLDPALVDRLPDAPGVYVLHDKNDVPLHIGKAGNLRLHLLNYFRTDRISKRAWDTSIQVGNITWRTTRGPIGAQLRHRALALASSRTSSKAASIYTWQMRPDRNPCLELISLSDREEASECYGLFQTARKARNGLRRLSESAGLCPVLLGIGVDGAHHCSGCMTENDTGDGSKLARLRQLTRTTTALRPWRVPHWPFPGPVGLKERVDMHIIDRWRYLGTAQNEAEVHDVLQCRPPDFDEKTFCYLAKTLPRLPRRRIVDLLS